VSHLVKFLRQVPKLPVQFVEWYSSQHSISTKIQQKTLKIKKKLLNPRKSKHFEKLKTSQKNPIFYRRSSQKLIQSSSHLFKKIKNLVNSIEHIKKLLFSNFQLVNKEQVQ